jgi:hypothetical protein
VNRILVALAAMAALAFAACSASTPTATHGTPTASEPAGVAPGGGDIPDNQKFLTYQGAVFSVMYPEGWTQSAGNDGVTFQDKDNRISMVIRSAPPPTVASVGSTLRSLPGAVITTQPHTVTLPGGAGVAATYQTDGDLNPVTGKRPRLTVDRYELAQSGKLAILELASPVGVDNVDAYRMIAQSFRWR